MARPRKSKGDLRRCWAHVRLTEKEQLALLVSANAADMNVGEYLRHRGLGHAIHLPPTKADADLLAEINRIGINVNQLAFATNSGRQFKGDWEAVRDEVSRVLAKVAELYAPEI